MREFTSRGYRVHEAVTRGFDRDRWGRWVYPVLCCQYLFTWVKAIVTSFRVSVVCLNLGQTRVAFLREGTPFRVIARLRPSVRRLVSLHGSVFMGWQRGDEMATRLLEVLRHAHVVTVLGPNQRQHLIQLGVRAEKVEILCNTCDIEELSADELRQKFERIDGKQPLKLLFLSNLIVSKGYLVYLNALKILAQQSGLPPISAILCGPLKISEFSKNFATVREAREEIQELIEQIQVSGRIEVQWIEGARGDAKLQIYKNTHLFVFPSQYPVEAQPLVLIEAMASGCAIVTSSVGEIPFTMRNVGWLVDEVSAQAVAEIIAKVVTDRENLAMQAGLGLDRYRSDFSVHAHLAAWERLLKN